MCGVTQDNIFRTVLFVNFGDMAQTAGNGDHVDRGITTTDHDNLFSNQFQSTFVKCTQEIDAGQAVVCLGAGDRQRTTGVCAHGPQDRIVVFFQVFNLNGEVVKTLNHDDPTSGQEPWDLLSDPVRAIATGLYVYVVEDLETGEIQRGKLVIIK